MEDYRIELESTVDLEDFRSMSKRQELAVNKISKRFDRYQAAGIESVSVIDLQQQLDHLVTHVAKYQLPV